MVGLAEEIIDRMTGEFEPDKFEDRYEQAMIELIRSKQAGLPAPKEKTQRPSCQRRQPDGCIAPQC
jgi:DNA end-binding protein Ku